MKKTRITHRGARIGDMRHRIMIHDRSITSPEFDSIDFGEDFDGTEAWAAILSTRGKVIMDDVGRDINATHELFIRFNSGVTAETFIQDEDGRRFKILTVEPYDERGEYMRLLATERGLNEAAKA